MKILITVKTYPTISEVKQDEFVCTAGLTEEGQWIRIYPIPFRSLDYVKQYKKYDWIEINLKKSKTDWRPESYQPNDIESINTLKVLEHLDTKAKWAKRKETVFRSKVYHNIELLKNEAKNKNIRTSLAVFKPHDIIDFKHYETEREWSERKIHWLNQMNLFEDKSQKIIIKKLPYTFKYIFTDKIGNKSELMIEDWEIGELFWNCFRKRGNEEEALKDVKNKYLHDFTTKCDIYLFLGTNYVHHSRNSKNPFVIIGVFYPPKEDQLKLEF